MPITAADVFGMVEILLTLSFFLGLGKTVSYTAGVLGQAVSIAVSILVMLSPFADPAGHSLVAGVPVLGGSVALFLMRDMDTWRVGSLQA